MLKVTEWRPVIVKVAAVRRTSLGFMSIMIELRAEHD